MSLFSDLFLPHISRLKAYTPGLQPTETGWTKLNTNECGYPPSPRVAEALVRELEDGAASLRLYPNPTSAPVRRAIAAYHGQGLEAENVIVGNGSDDILNLLVRCLGGPGAATGFTYPSYSLYPVLVEIQAGHSRVIEFERSMELPVDQIAISSAKGFFLTSPNAPTGVSFANRQLEEILERFHGILVVDEAYAPFARENAVELLSRHPRLVVVRTLSKAHALAGIRVGYALGHPEIIASLDRVRDSYNVSRLSQVAAVAALGDVGYYSALIEKIKATRDFYRNAWMTKLGWFSFPSEANFIFVEPKAQNGQTGLVIAQSVYHHLLSRKILVRAFPNHPLTASFLRISVGTDDEMLLVHQALLAWQPTAPSV
ncbi:MAG: histidinol-phosphate transaminase [Opitutaceae bacterium]|nr:histidinol-phosphate transaminase [Opitutaceae bacterium]